MSYSLSASTEASAPVVLFLIVADFEVTPYQEHWKRVTEVQS